MDEILFRLHQRLEALQVQGNILSQNGTDLLHQYIEQSRTVMSQALNNAKVEELQRFLTNNLTNFKQYCMTTKNNVTELIHPTAIYGYLTLLFRNEFVINNTFYLLLGLCIGGAGGTIFGWYLRVPATTPQFMKAVVAISYRGVNAVTSSQTVHVPVLNRQSDEVLIKVKAAGLVRLDDRIAKGYARLLRGLYSRNKGNFPIILGRACSGIVEAVGGASDIFEQGDEVWAVVPYYFSGIASEHAILPQNHIARKPRQLGFEAAASLPYSGIIALEALQDAHLDEVTSRNRRIFILGGNSPVGCVLGQLLQSWGAHVTVSCAPIGVPVAKALGCHDVITITPDLDNSISEDMKDNSEILIKELRLNDPFDLIFLTIESNLKKYRFNEFLSKNGRVISTVEPELLSDNFGFILRIFYSLGFYTKRLIEYLLGKQGVPPNLILDRLALFVDSYQLRTVVDKVFTPTDAELAIAHSCSPEAIGNTIITFQ